MPKGRRGSQNPKMSQRPASPLYFPSLYDRGISSSLLSDFNIWKKLFVPLKAGGEPAAGVAGVAGLRPPAVMPPPPPGLGPPTERPCPPWPSGIASIPYEPLRFFYSPPPGPEVAASALVPGPTTPWLASASHPEELCELEIQIKELELLTITGDGFDSQRYKFLKALKDEKLQGLKMTRQPGKSASFS
uniref:RIKEN cDNA A930018P22 gene n=1 Tax=Nannospalax galili TaxID=1026970 RepID=A0A8C6RTW0_NANGA